MAKFLNPFLLLLLLASCTGKNQTEQQDKTALIAEQKRLRTALQEVEEKLTALDTNTNNRALVYTQKVERGTFQHFVDAQGSLESKQTLQIFAEVPGKVMRIEVKEGQAVSQGTVLMRMETDIIDQQIKELKSAFEFASFTYEKQKSLHDQGVASLLEYKTAKNNFESVQQKLKAMKNQREKSIVTAPISGYVDKIYARAGEINAGQMPAFRLVNTDNIYAEFEMSESYVGRIEKGALAEVSVPTLQAKFENLQVTHAGQYIHPNNRTFTVQIALKKDKRLVPNLIVKAKIKDFEEKNTLVIPSFCVQQDNKGNAYVYVVAEGQKAEKRAVQLGMQYEQNQQILEGLTAGELLVVKGFKNIRQGQALQVKMDN